MLNYLKLPLTVKKSVDQKSQTCTFTLNMSWQMAEQLIDIAAPFMRDLSSAVEKHHQEELERKKHLAYMQDEYSRISMIAIHSLRICRKKCIHIDDIADRIALRKNIDPNALKNAYHQQLKERFRKLESFKERRVIKLANMGISKHAISKSLKISHYRVNRIISDAGQIKALKVIN